MARPYPLGGYGSAMRAIRISEWGGPEVLELVEDAARPEADEHHVLIRVTRAGINFADTHARENTYLARYELPFSPGAEVAGVVEEDGAGFAAGQRVVALVGTGGYAEYVAAPSLTTVAVPDGVSDATALGLLLQGLTAWHLYATSAKLAPGESVVVHAAGGSSRRPRPRTSARWRSSSVPTRPSTSRARTSPRR
jgi:NADPH:quinone reductase